MLDLFIEFNLFLHSSKRFVEVFSFVEQLERSIFWGDGARFNRSANGFRRQSRLRGLDRPTIAPFAPVRFQNF